jgi:hypothetical protein
MAAHIALLLLAASLSTPAISGDTAEDTFGKTLPPTTEALYSARQPDACCYDKIDLERQPSGERQASTTPECCWVPVFDTIYYTPQ